MTKKELRELFDAELGWAYRHVDMQEELKNIIDALAWEFKFLKKQGRKNK